MKLTNDIKNKIDTYFSSISADELFSIAISKYNFVEIGVEYSGKKLNVVNKSVYNTYNNSEIFDLKSNSALSEAA